MSSGRFDELLDRLKPDPGDEGGVSVSNVVSHFDSRGFGPLLVISGLLAVLPTGLIPGMGLVSGTLIVAFSIQLLLGRSDPWVPGFIGRREISASRLRAAVDKGRGAARLIDRWLEPRYEQLCRPPFSRVVAAIGVLIGLSMFPLAALPFGNAVGGAAIVFFGLGLVADDGLTVAFGLIASLGAVVMALSLGL